jgi:hypothetical protein
VKLVEGVPWYRFVIRFRLLSGERRRMVRWSPGEPWIREEIARELSDRQLVIKPGSVTYRMQEPTA